MTRIVAWVERSETRERHLNRTRLPRISLRSIRATLAESRRDLQKQILRVDAGVIVGQQIERHRRNLRQHFVERRRVGRWPDMSSQCPLPERRARLSFAAEIVKITGFGLSHSVGQGSKIRLGRRNSIERSPEGAQRNPDSGRLTKKDRISPAPVRRQQVFGQSLPARYHHGLHASTQSWRGAIRLAFVQGLGRCERAGEYCWSKFHQCRREQKHMRFVIVTELETVA